jgi:hypothetical protein
MLYATIMICWMSGCSILFSGHGFAERADCVAFIETTINQLPPPFERRMTGCGPIGEA